MNNNQFGLNSQFGTGLGVATGFNSALTGKTVNDTINNIDNYQTATKQKYNNEKNIALENQAKTMYECAYRTNDGQVRKQNLSGANLSSMELIIKQAAQEHGSTAYDDLGDGQILCKFIQDNPQYEQISNGTLGGDVNLKTWSRVIGANTSTPEKPSSSAWQNIVQAAGDTLMGPGKFVANQIDKGTARLAKQFSDNEEKVDQQLQENLEYMPTLPNVDRDSTTYQVANFGTDVAATIATSFIPGLREAEWANLLSKTPRLVKLAQQYPKAYRILSSVLKNSSEGIRDMALLNAFNGEGTSLSEAAEGGAANVVMNPALKAAGKVLTKVPGAESIIKKSAEKLEVMGNLSPNDVRKAMAKLAERGEFDQYQIGPDNIGEFLLQRGIKGNKDEMFKQLMDYSDSAKEMLEETIKQSTSTHNMPTATKALNAIAKDLEGVAGMEDDYKLVKSLIKEGDNYNGWELQKVKNVIDDYENIYTNAGDVKAGFGARGMAKMRREIKKKIEEIGESEGLGNIRALNNEIAMSKVLALGMGNKSASEIVNQWTSGALGSLTTAIAGGDLKQVTFMGALAALMGSSKVRTNIANALKSVGGIEEVTLQEIRDYVASKGTKELSNESKSALRKILSENLWVFEGLERGTQNEIIRIINEEE